MGILKTTTTYKSHKQFETGAPANDNTDNTITVIPNRNDKNWNIIISLLCLLFKYGNASYILFIACTNAVI